jgi:hypothetical protein
MSTRLQQLLTTFASAYLVALLAGQTRADVSAGHNIGFSAVNQNPWQPGPEFSLQHEGSIFNHNFHVDYPKLNGKPGLHA